MADDGQATFEWKAPQFHFQVNWGGVLMSFQEVTGLDSDTDPIKYRSGNSDAISLADMPGLKKSGNIILKRGTVASDTAFREWFNQIQLNEIKRVPVTIRLMDETGAATTTWTVTNAYPLKISGITLDAGSSDAAIESIDVAHDGLTTG